MPLFQTQDAKYGKVKTLMGGTNACIIAADFTIPAGVVVNDVVELGAIPHASASSTCMCSKMAWAPAAPLMWAC